ncbi:MAG TPA: hypothetical protein VGW38_10215 [Chloroflexota bacterium]|nr:hypothetical protein [Chloroflexota bacterium]
MSASERARVAAFSALSKALIGTTILSVGVKSGPDQRLCLTVEREGQRRLVTVGCNELGVWLEDDQPNTDDATRSGGRGQKEESET